MNLSKRWLISIVLVATNGWAQDARWLEGPGFDMEGPTGDLYGFVMLDAGYNAGRNDPDWFDVMRPTKLPAFENEFGEDGEVYFSVRQTRFGLKYWQPTETEHDIRGIFEWELFGVGEDAGQTTFRLRHAYLQYDKFGAGQYHSVFMDMDIFPDSVEYWGPTGMILFRNLQVRYMPVMGDKHNVAISFEKPGASGDAGRYDEFVEARSGLSSSYTLPDLAAHYRYDNDWGHVQIAGILRRIAWDDNTGDGQDFSGGTTGWGFNLTGNRRLGNGMFKVGLVWGEGIENYLNDGGPDVAAIPNPIDPDDPSLRPGGIVKIPVLAASLFYDYRWSESLTSTIGLSVQDRDLDKTAALPEAFQAGQYALANMTWYPVKALMTAIELQYGRRENFSDGWTYDAFRVQFSTKYRFSFKLGDKP